MKSLYSFYKKFFRYPNNDNIKRSRIFLFAIKDTIKILYEVFNSKSDIAIQRYRSRDEKKKSTLVLKFIKNLEEIVHEKYDNPLQTLEFYDAVISVDKNSLANRRKNIELSCPYLLDRRKQVVIIINFLCKEDRIMEENKVLKSLIKYFGLDKSWPASISNIIYWDLNNGREMLINLDTLQTVPKEKLISALKEL